MTAKITLDEFIVRASKIHNFKYDYSKSTIDNIKIKIICLIHGEFEQRSKNHLSGSGCYKCGRSSAAQKLTLDNNIIDQFLIDNNIKIVRVDNYTYCKSKINWRCLKCNNIWLASQNSIFKFKGCPKCSSRKLSNEIVDSKLKDLKLNIIRLGNFSKVRNKLEWKCLVCNNTWFATSGDLLKINGSGCPNCSRCKNEKLISKLLNNSNVIYKKITLKFNNRKCYPDFYLPKYNLIIEYNGDQHYKPIRFGNISKEEAIKQFEKQKIRDENLRIYCKENSTNLLEIDGRKYVSIQLEKYINYLIKNNFNV